MLMSPCSVMVVSGFLVVMASIAFCRLSMNVGMCVFGRRYVLMKVWVARVLAEFLISIMYVAVSGMVMSVMMLWCMLVLIYMVMSVLW